MIKYLEGGDLACVDGYSFRRDKKTGYYLSSKIINGRRMRLHVYIWEKEKGKVPKGLSIHHIDGNKNNNDISNFEIMSNSDHSRLHGANLSDEERKIRAERLKQNGVPAARAWHGTEKGYQWHSEHAKETMRNRKPIKYICTHCGEGFESKHIYSSSSNTFCSNKCKSAFRRNSGVDNVIKICEECGNEYTASKYHKTKHCKDCKNRKSRF